MSSREGAPDRRWAGALPRLLLDLRGGVAERAIAHIDKALPEYPFSEYRIWPGPNSNTFTAWLVRKVPELNVELPATAIGKNTIHAIQAGLVLGYADMVKGMVARFDKELGGGCKVVATGGLAGLIEKEADIFDAVNLDLTLAGLRIIHELNS